MIFFPPVKIREFSLYSFSQHNCTIIVVSRNLQYCLNVSVLFLSADDNENKSRVEKCHTSGKRKKKKRQRKDEDSLDSDTECPTPKRDNKCAQSSPPRLVEELPDIIPKQVKSHKNESKKQC